MRKITIKISAIFALILLMVFLQSQNIYSQQQKLAQTGMKFLNVSLDARATAFGDAITSLETNSSAMFYNPAGMARFEGIADVSLGQTKWIADITYYNASVAFAPFEGDYGVFGFSFVSVDYGDFFGTIRADNEQGYLDVGTFSPTAIAFGFGYAKSLSEKFAVGGNVKYVRQSLGTSIVGNVVQNPLTAGFASGTTQDNELDVLAFDFGVIYKTGFKSLNIGMSVRNFSREVQYKEEGFQLPLIFQIGTSFNFSDLLELDKNEHSILVTADANHPRDFPEQILFGFEYTFMNMLSLRGGYSAPNDERDITAGVGLKQNIQGLNLGIDYSYTDFGIFNSVHRITINFAY
ncbi:MAG: PorV/PorQ family protein [Ignavibacteriaceae bacterium]|nr:PorV/PorQ family protein [Ignavibacteriaceae bacterium]